MSKVIHRIRMDMLNPGLPPVLHMTNTDSARKIEIHVSGMDLEGYTARIIARKPSMLEVYNDCIIAGNVVTFDVTNQMLAEDGCVVAQVELEHEEDGTVTSFDIVIKVRKKISGDCVKSTNESTYLERLFNEYNNSGSGGEGMNDAVKETLLLLFNNIVYTNDMSSTISRLSQLFSDGVVSYPVTNNLTNLTTSNTNETVEEGTNYIAVLTPDEGYSIESVTVTMNGTDITGTSYADGTVNILSVSGEIVITANAIESVKLEPVYEISETAFDGATVIDTQCNLFDEDKAWTIVSDFSNSANGGSVWAIDKTGFTANTQMIALRHNNNWYWRVEVYTSAQNVGAGTVANCKCVVTKDVNASKLDVYYLADGVKNHTELTTDARFVPLGSSAVGVYDNLKLGYSAVRNEYFTGTIHDLKAYERILDDAEINAYLGGVRDGNI